MITFSYFPWVCLHSVAKIYAHVFLFCLFVLLLCLFLFVFFPKQVSYLNVVNFSAKHVLLVHIQVVAWGREKK